ncbi:hypothetical protein AB0H03_21465 [Streptomyces sparsogenes]|uniref:hypothetical protein n=1 Tax=Streptomyces sparsogenes TaxID=67365 RepID=UPI003410CFAD
MDGRIPQPHDATDSAQFVAVMRQLRQWANLSYRELERRATAAGDVLPRATLAGALNRQELPREDLVAAFVRACGGDEATVKAWIGARKRLAVELESLAPGEARHEAEGAGAASEAEGPGAEGAGTESAGTESAGAGAAGAGAESAGAEGVGASGAGAESAGAPSAGAESAGAGAAGAGAADEPDKQVARAGVSLRPAEVTVPTPAEDETEALTLAEPMAAGRATGSLAAKPPTGPSTTPAANPPTGPTTTPAAGSTGGPTTGPTTTPAADPTADPAHPEPEPGAKKAWRRLRRPGLVIAATVAIVLLTAAATAMLRPGDDPGEPRKGRPGVPTASHSPSGTPSRPQDGDPSKAAEAEPAKGESPRATTPAATSPAPSSGTTAPEKPKSKSKPTPRHSSRTPEWTPYDPPADPYDPSPSADDSPTSDGGDPFPEETCWDVTNDCV